MQEKDLFPLRDSLFEGKPVKIPYNYAELLEEEYGKKSLTNIHFEQYDSKMPLFRETAALLKFLQPHVQLDKL